MATLKTLIRQNKISLLSLARVYIQSKAGLPDGLFSNQPPSFGTFWKAFEWKILISFMTIWYTVWPFDLFYGNLVYFVCVCQIIPVLVYCFKTNLATLVESSGCVFLFSHSFDFQLKPFLATALVESLARHVSYLFHQITLIRMKKDPLRGKRKTLIFGQLGEDDQKSSKKLFQLLEAFSPFAI
jgi:hypothetical protein